MKLLLVCVLLTVVSLQVWAHRWRRRCNLYRKALSKSSCCYRRNRGCCQDKATGACYCDIYSSSSSCFIQTGNEVFYSALANKASKCCGSLKIRFYNLCHHHHCQPIGVQFQYYPSKLERNGLCKMTHGVVPNTPMDHKPEMGSCVCRREAVGCVDPNMKPSPAPTAAPTSAPTPAPTTPLPALCPTAPVRTFGRMLGGTPVGDSCSVNGVFNFRVGSTQVCNGVLGYNPATQTNQMFLTDFCLNLAKAVTKLQSITAVGFYNSVPFEVSSDITATAVGNNISTIAAPAGVLPMSRCKTTACLYNPATMSKLIDFNSCFVPSYGYDYKIGNTAYNSGSLNRVDVTRKSSCTTTATSPNAKCFAATNPKVRGCWGDNGAPVYCKLTTTKETVLYGMVDFIGKPPEVLTGSKTPDLCESTNEFHVLPIA